MRIPERLKKIGLAAAIALLPLLFCANVWQSFRYSSLKREIARLEAEQRDLLEKNKRNIAGISVLESPGRVDSLGREELGLSRPGVEGFITIRPPGKDARPEKGQDADE
ncbi:MAG: septum formation initiator family protein [Spirochaetia bacterium]|jgi:cell division protein FtsB|nr:septum formation initiator family protein [Spirochaetia bacterium]